MQVRRFSSLLYKGDWLLQVVFDMNLDGGCASVRPTL
jgi:hypothetical protein